jgi:hypothetical protein
LSRRQINRIALAAALAAAMLVGPGGDIGCVHAQSPTCRSTCLASYNQCRLATKGSPACDAQYQACLQACVAR